MPTANYANDLWWWLGDSQLSGANEWLADIGTLGGQDYEGGMTAAENLPPKSLGLWGDGDEIAAIRDVETLFGIRLDYSDARNWLTTGDVFAALQRELPTEQALAADTWSMFTKAISEETGVNPSRVTAETLLLGRGRFSWKTSLVVAAVAAVILVLILRL